MTREEAINALDIVKHMESFAVFYEPGEPMNPTTVRELKEACKMAISILRAQTDTTPNTPLTLEQLREMEGEPVTHGFWNIEHPIDFRVKPWSVSCSICGWSTDSKTDYCPKCGAKMDAEAYRHKP